MQTIALYADVNPGFETNPTTLAVVVWLQFQAVKEFPSIRFLMNTYGAVVVARQDVHDAFLTNELTEGRTFIVSNAALQAEDCAIDAATAEPFTDAYFARIDLGLVYGRPPLYRFRIEIGKPPKDADYQYFDVVDGVKGGAK